MKDYKKVEMVAKNAPSGSYAAGCPADTNMQGAGKPRNNGWEFICRNCERTA